MPGFVEHAPLNRVSTRFVSIPMAKQSSTDVGIVGHKSMMMQLPNYTIGDSLHWELGGNRPIKLPWIRIT